jgi:hypothetical protein
MSILLELLLIIICVPLIIFGIYQLKNGSFSVGLFLIICNTFTVTLNIISIIQKLN